MAFLIKVRNTDARGGAPPYSAGHRKQREFPHPFALRITITALIAALILHAGFRRAAADFWILPGIVFTLVGSLISGIVFGQYLARFANNYVTMYAGLASVIIALVFLYFIAAIFVYGGELNAAIIKSRLPHGVSLQAAQSLEPLDSQA
jgi:membrane protein